MIAVALILTNLIDNALSMLSESGAIINKKIAIIRNLGVMAIFD